MLVFLYMEVHVVIVMRVVYCKVMHDDFVEMRSRTEQKNVTMETEWMMMPVTIVVRIISVEMDK